VIQIFNNIADGMGAVLAFVYSLVPNYGLASFPLLVDSTPVGQGRSIQCHRCLGRCGKRLLSESYEVGRRLAKLVRTIIDKGHHTLRAAGLCICHTSHRLPIASAVEQPLDFVIVRADHCSKNLWFCVKVAGQGIESCP